MKKFLSLSFVFLASVFFLAACGNEETPAAEETNGEAIAGGPAEIVESDEVIELSFWHAMTGAHEVALNNVIDAFHDAHPNIRINAEFQGNYTDMNQQIIASAVAGTLPHIVQQTTDNVTEYIQDGLVIDLTPFVEATLTAEEQADIFPVFWEAAQWDGEFRAIPFGKSTRVLFYNVDVFEAYGFTVPTSWEELEEIAIALTDMNAEPQARFGMGFENGWGAEFIALNRQFGGEYIDEATATAMFGEESGIAAAQFVINMIDQGYARFAGEDNFLSGVFGNQGVAMYIGSSAGFVHVNNAVDGTFTWNTAPLPTYNGNAASRFQGNDLMIMDNNFSDEEIEAAWAFLRFTLNTDIAARWATESGYIPISQSALDSDIWTNFIAENPHAAAAANQMDAGFITARVPGANPVWQILVEELNNIRDNENSMEYVPTALQRAQERANAALGN